VRSDIKTASERLFSGSKNKINPLIDSSFQPAYWKPVRIVLMVHCRKQEAITILVVFNANDL
jgi:hypothetical protein